MGQECESDGSQECHWSIRRQGGVHRNAALQACRCELQEASDRSLHAWADHTFFYFTFVLTGVDESKATANESLGGVERLLRKGG